MKPLLVRGVGAVNERASGASPVQATFQRTLARDEREITKGATESD
jgi:hypothetical protein